MNNFTLRVSQQEILKCRGSHGREQPTVRVITKYSRWHYKKEKLIMVTINGEPNIFLSILCMSICFISFLIPVITMFVHSIHSRIRFAKQIQQNQANGLYDDWNKPPLSNRLRVLGLLGLISGFGMLGWFITGFINPATMFSLGRLIIFGAFAITGLVVGIVLQHMVTKGT